jgi:hypothetical protein
MRHKNGPTSLYRITTVAVVFTRYATVFPLSELINFFQCLRIPFQHRARAPSPAHLANISSSSWPQAHLRVTPLPLIATSSQRNSDSSLTESSLLLGGVSAAKSFPTPTRKSLLGGSPRCSRRCPRGWLQRMQFVQTLHMTMLVVVVLFGGTTSRILGILRIRTGVEDASGSLSDDEEPLPPPLTRMPGRRHTQWRRLPSDFQAH